ncbi:MAG: hypothetical protein AAF823_01980 [Planctomycetota bacterium]
MSKAKRDRQLRRDRRVALWMALLLAVALARPLAAQTMPAAWVEESDRLMRQNRTADLRVVVLDHQANPVSGAVVEARQLAHDLPLAFHADRQGLDGIDFTKPVYRHFNAVALDRLVDWPTAHPRRDANHPMLAARRVAHQARQRGLNVRLGPVVSEDPAVNPDWLSPLPPVDLAAAIEARLDATLAEFVSPGSPATQLDLVGDALAFSDLTLRLGPQYRRWMVDRARAAAPHATLCIRLSDALTGHRRARLADVAASLREDFIDADLIAIDQRVTGGLQRAPLLRTVEAIDRLGYGITLASLDVGGPSPEAAAYHLELLLRTLAPSPALHGIAFATVVTPPTDDPAATPHAGLIDALGDPTPAGQVFDRLFGEHWASNEVAVTDPELASASFRLFTGTYEFTVHLPPTATHPDGQTFTQRLHLPPSDALRLTVLQPLRDTE